MDEFLEERELGSLLFALALVTDEASIDRIHLPKMNNKSIYTIKYKDFECNISTADATNYDIILQNFINTIYAEKFGEKITFSNDDTLYASDMKILAAIEKIVKDDRRQLILDKSFEKRLLKISNKIDFFHINYMNSNTVNEERGIINTAVVVANHFKNPNEEINTDSIVDSLEEGLTLEDFSAGKLMSYFGYTDWLHTPERKYIDIEGEKNFIKLIAYSYASKHLKPVVSNFINLDNTLALSYFPKGDQNPKLYFLHNRESQVEDSKEYLHSLYYDLSKFSGLPDELLPKRPEEMEYVALGTIRNGLYLDGLHSLINSYVTTGTGCLNYGMDTRVVGSAILTLKDIVSLNREDFSVDKIRDIINKNYNLVIQYPELPMVFIKEYGKALQNQMEDMSDYDDYDDEDYNEL